MLPVIVHLLFGLFSFSFRFTSCCHYRDRERGHDQGQWRRETWHGLMVWSVVRFEKWLDSQSSQFVCVCCSPACILTRWSFEVNWSLTVNMSLDSVVSVWEKGNREVEGSGEVSVKWEDVE